MKDGQSGPCCKNQTHDDRQTIQEMARKVELSVTGKAPKEPKRNGLNQDQVYYYKRKNKRKSQTSKAICIIICKTSLFNIPLKFTDYFVCYFMLIHMTTYTDALFLETFEDKYSIF